MSNQQRNYASRWVGSKSDKGPTRAANEDALWVPDGSTPTELGALYIVADGVGGQKFGAAASWLAVETISEAFYEQRRQNKTIGEALSAAIHKANRAIFVDAKKRRVKRMGSTVVAAVQEDGLLHIGHVGDARAYLLRQRELKQLTRDDTWVQRQVDAGIITADEAARHELRNIVTQVLGNQEAIEVHLSQPLALQNGDTILLCSDGIYDAVSPVQIHQILTEYDPPEAALRFIEVATEAGARDNITAVVLAPHITPREVTNDDIPTAKITPPAPQPPLVAEKQPFYTTPLFALILLALILGGSLYWYFTMGIAVPEDTPAEAEPELILDTETAIDAFPAACLVETAFLWTEEQLTSDECSEVALEEIEANTRILRLSNEVKSAQGPDALCADNRFVQIQVADNDTQNGWVLETAVSAPLDAGETCSP